MKPCPFCAEQIQDAAIKCRYCGSMLFQAPALPVAPPGMSLEADAAGLPLADGPRAPEEPARVLFDGCPSWRSRFWTYVGLVTAGLGGAFLFTASYLRPQAVGGMPQVTVPAGLVLLALALLAVLAFEVVRRADHIRISTRTIDLESGILSKRITTLQLWRIREIDYAQSLGERVLRISRIHIGAGEKQPELVLRGLPATRDLFIALRDAVGIARQSKNVLGLVE